MGCHKSLFTEFAREMAREGEKIKTTMVMSILLLYALGSLTPWKSLEGKELNQERKGKKQGRKTIAFRASRTYGIVQSNRRDVSHVLINTSLHLSGQTPCTK